MKKLVKIFIILLIIAIAIFSAYFLHNYKIVNEIVEKHKDILISIVDDTPNYYYKEIKTQNDFVWTTEEYHKDGIYKSFVYSDGELYSIAYSNLNTGEYVEGMAGENGMEIRNDDVVATKSIMTVYGFSNLSNYTKFQVALTSGFITTKNGEYIFPNAGGDTKIYIDKETGLIKKWENSFSSGKYIFEKDKVTDNDVSRITAEDVKNLKRELEIIRDISKKQDEFVNKGNYHQKVTIDEEKALIEIDLYRKAEKSIMFSKYTVKDTKENAKTIYYNDGNKIQMYYETGKEKIIEENPVLFTMNSVNLSYANSTDKEIIEGKRLSEFSVQEAMYKDKKCYLYKSDATEEGQVAYIDISTGMVIKCGNTECEFEFDNVEDSIFELPDMSGYTLNSK